MTLTNILSMILKRRTTLNNIKQRSVKKVWQKMGTAISSLQIQWRTDGLQM